MLFMKGGKGSALTQVTEAKDHVSITIPAGKGGTLKAIYLQVKNTLETVVNSGGLVKARNSSADWEPCHLLTAYGTVVTEGGEAEAKPMMYAVSKILPGNSVCYFDFTPYDNQSQYLEVTLVWEAGVMPKEETFSGSIHPLKAAGVTATSRASPGSYAVPGGKGGRIYALGFLPWATLETVVCAGGLAELTADAYDLTPCEFYTTSVSSVGASGGATVKPDIVPYDSPMPENGNITAYYTPRDDQNQTLSVLIMWKLALRRKIS